MPEIDFVPIAYYTRFFDVAVLGLIMLAFAQCMMGVVLKAGAVKSNAVMGFVLMVILTIYMGLRPVSYVFGDTVNYAAGFRQMAEIGIMRWEWSGDWLFYNLMRWFAVHSDIHSFFLLCAILYVAPLWIAMHRIFKDYSYLPFLVIISMFTFWAYGVNGIRNGIAASLVILAMTYVERIPVMVGLCILATGFHSSIYLMIAAGVMAWLVNNSYIYLAGWLLCVVVSYFVGGTIQDFLANSGLMGGDDRFADYLTGAAQEGEVVQTSMTFRWDFLIYSSMGVLVGWFFIFMRDFKDEYYHWLYNIFLITNAFWVLVIRSAYSNRFAQISWFILPVILIYPFMKKRFWQNHEMVLGIGLLVFYAFTFYFNIWK